MSPRSVRARRRSRRHPLREGMLNLRTALWLGRLLWRPVLSETGRDLRRRGRRH